MSFGIDLLRHFFSLAVILQHMSSTSRYSQEINLQLMSMVNWIDCAVAGFFFISGFLFKQPKCVFFYIKKQSLKLLVPFFLFSLIYAVILAILGKAILFHSLIETLMLRGASMQLYFLPDLLFILVTFVFFSKKLPHKLTIRIAIFFMAVLMSICLVFPTYSSTGPSYKLIPFYYVAFMLGWLYQNILTLRNNLILTLFAIFILLFIGRYDSRFYDLTNVSILFVIVRSMSSHFPERRLFGSGAVYLLHTPILNYVISIVLFKVGVFDWINICLSVIITYLLCVLIGFGVARYYGEYKWLILE